MGNGSWYSWQMIGNAIGGGGKSAPNVSPYQVKEDSFKDSKYDSRRKELGSEQDALKNRGEVSGIGKQFGLGQKLEDIATGKSATVSETKLKQQQGQNVAGILGAANTGAGGGGDLGSLADSISGSNLKAANDASIAGLAERNAALGQAGGLYGTAAGQQLTGRGLDDAQSRYLLSQKSSQDQHK